MTIRTQIHKKKFGKKCFRNQQGTMSHRPLTNTSSLKIAAAYCPGSFSAYLLLAPTAVSMSSDTCFRPVTLTITIRNTNTIQTLIKKKISSYIRKSRCKRLQSHIWGRVSLKYRRKCANMRRPLVILHMTLQPISENFLFFQCITGSER